MDEARSARTALERLRASLKPRVLFVSHAERGGVARHVAALARCLEDDVEALLLRPHDDSHVTLRWLREGEPMALFLESGAQWESLVALLAAVGIDRVHIHHVHGLPRSVLDLPERLGCPHDVTLHDYFPACPSYHLTDASGRYCARAPGCQLCLESRAPQWPGSVDDWRRAFAPFLASAARVIAPSVDTARRIVEFFGDVPVVTWAHPEAEPAEGLRPVRVLIPGAISPAKGLDVIEACAADAAARKLPLYFRVLGYVARPLREWPDAPVSVGGEYPEGRLRELIAIEHGDACFFPSQCPETFSYTLSAALDSGLPIIATNLGAIAERLAGRSNARVLAWDAQPREFNDALMAVAGPSAQVPATRPRVTFEAYRERYFAGWPSRRGASPPLPDIDPGWVRPPRAAPSTPSLAFLFEDGVLCGKAGSLEALRRYAFDPYALYAAADARLRELMETLEAQGRDAERRCAAARAEVEEQKARAMAVEERLQRVEASRSWRMTRPLRGLARWMRGSD